MQKANEDMNVLLIEEESTKVGLLRHALESSQVRYRLNTIGQGKSALAYLRRIGPYQEAPVPDLIFLDFSEPDASAVSLMNKLAFGPRQMTSPVVLLTSRASEELLEAACETHQDSSLFAPVDLTMFLHSMMEQRQDRFLNALSLISSLGLILVRLPGSFLQQRSQHQRVISA